MTDAVKGAEKALAKKKVIKSKPLLKGKTTTGRFDPKKFDPYGQITD